MSTESRILVVDEGENGERLDRFLAGRCPDLSRSRLQRLIAEGQVTVDGLAARPSYRLAVGQRALLRAPCPAPSRLEHKPFPSRWYTRTRTCL